MTTRPTPPEGYGTWLDFIVTCPQSSVEYPWLEPQPTTDATTLGERIDSALRKEVE